MNAETKIWLVYAGYNRRFLEDFSAKKRVFLNLPGFNASASVFADDTLLRRHLAMADAVGRYVRTDVPNPARTPSSYSPTPYVANSAESRRFGHELGNIQRLFLDAKVGDLIMSPAHGQFEPLLIGEIATNWSKSDDLVVTKLKDEVVPARKVRWLNVALTKRDFAPRTARRLVNRHAITQLDESLYQDVFDNVYPNYSWNDRSKLDIFGNGYAGKDPLQPYDAAKLIKYIMSSVFAYQSGEIDTFNDLSVDQAITQFYDEDLVEELSQNFNSPGKFMIIVMGSLMSTLVAGGLVMATANHTEGVTQQRNQVSQQIGAVMTGPGKAAAEAELNNYLHAVRGDVWKPVQQNLGKSAKQSLGLSLNNSVEVARHRNELNAR